MCRIPELIEKVDELQKEADDLHTAYDSLRVRKPSPQAMEVISEIPPQSKSA